MFWNYIKFLVIISLFFQKTLHAFSIDKALCPSMLNASITAHDSHKNLKEFFTAHQLNVSNHITIVTNPLLLQKLAHDTLFYIKRYEQAHQHVISPADFNHDILPTHKVKKTLKWLIKLVEEDKQQNTPFRILDPNFIKKHFDCIAWKGDVATARKKNELFVEDGKVRLTHYAVFECSGSYTKTKEHPHALYQQLARNHYLSFTKQQMLNGVLEKKVHKKKVKPLVWLSREALEEALMQGTIFITMPDGKKRVFNVDISNNIPYNKKIKDMRHQKRYWFFREISPKTTTALLKRYSKRKNVAFAGDIYSIGIGKLIAISYTNRLTKKEEMRLGILVDTGGAFIKNLYQIDSFAGIFSSRSDLKNHTSTYPNTVHACILFKKD